MAGTKSEELTQKLLDVFSANFNDGEPVTDRRKSKDMYSVSVMIEFIEEFVPEIIGSEIAKAKEELLDELEKHKIEHIAADDSDFYFDYVDMDVIEAKRKELREEK